MSIKSLIQSLYKLSGSQAMPSNSGSVENTVSANSAVVAPFDGYATLRLESASDYAIRYARILSNNLDSAVYATGSNTSNGMQFAMVYVPVRKGSNVSAIFAGVSSGTIRFIKTVGAS